MIKYMIGAITFLISLLISLEISYRYQIFDTYSPELSVYNRSSDLDSPPHSSVLVLGNSISIVPNNYVDILRRDLPGTHIVNSAISGSGTDEMRRIAGRRFSTFNPKLVIFEVSMVANIYDIRHVVIRNHISAVRYYYWKISDWSRFVSYLDYRVGQFDFSLFKKPGAVVSLPAEESEHFDISRFGRAARAQVFADPTGIDDAIFLNGSQRQDGPAIVKNIISALDYCRPEDCRALVLVVPHPVQAAPIYMERYAQLGAVFPDQAKLQELNFPFLRLLMTRLQDRKNVSVISPLPALQAEERAGHAMFLVNDFHPTKEGQRLLADILLKAILPSKQ